MMDELKNSQKHFNDNFNFGGKMVEAGCFLAYADDIRKFFHHLTGVTPEDQAKKYSNDQTFNLYRNLINREAPNILQENSRSYIKPALQHEKSETQKTEHKCSRHR
jgi:hypothetical protein